MEITGGCHCGKIRYKSKIDPEKISICHCTDCQILTGCAYRISAYPLVEDFKLLKGNVKSYVKTTDSGVKRVQAFCADCGTPLYAESLEMPKIRSLRVGSIDQRASLKPRRQNWCKSAFTWSGNILAIPRFEKGGTW